MGEEREIERERKRDDGHYQLLEETSTFLKMK
jgi:hypothetical protein